MKKLVAALIMVFTFVTPCYAGQLLDRGVYLEKSDLITADSMPETISCLRVNLGDKKIEVKPVLAQNKFGSVENLSQMAINNMAIGGINGTLFNMKLPYTPVDSLIQGGKLLSMSPRPATAFIMTYDNQFIIDKVQPSIDLVFASGSTVQVDYVNRTPGDGVVLYTPDMGTSTNNPPTTLEAALEKDLDGKWKITGVYNGNCPIPENGYALSFQGSATSEGINDLITGSKLDIQYKNMNNIRYLWACGPGLVKNGAVIVPMDYEELQGSIVNDRHPRSAVGITADNRLLLVTVDGSNSEGSTGMTYEELAAYMVTLGAQQAMALDGGGSTELWAGNQVVNNPDEGKERPIMNGLLIISQIPVYVNSERLYFDVPPIIEQGRTLLPVRKIMEKIGAQISWDDKSDTVSIQTTEKTISLKIGARQAVVNGKTVNLDVPPKIIEGRTMMPIRFISENLDFKVQWDAARERVYIAK